MTTENEDLPTIMASIMVDVPRIAFGSGIAYLRMKRRARKSAKIVYRELVANGIPEEAARGLSYSFEEDISVRKLARNFGMPSEWPRPDWNSGK